MEEEQEDDDDNKEQGEQGEHAAGEGTGVGRAHDDKVEVQLEAGDSSFKLGQASTTSNNESILKSSPSLGKSNSKCSSRRPHAVTKPTNEAADASSRVP
ncbi:hypothetical protein BGX31_000775 [Mortierella sp. GBA43]|nr:hypothetical protein BGX31_000775 [Mortierella sp. GBA43]